jgi:hypothetical protein|tara:strand:+ start:319 stop:564 length:246 start_codon:yes stop_codon:yes gene_type:complete
MITYFTALLLTYTLQGEIVTARFWLNSYEQCIESMDHMIDMYDYIADNVSDNRMYLRCEQTEVFSGINEERLVKPRLRPNS